MRKLAILITQYNETDKDIKPLLDSIEIQQNIDFEDIEVIISNNGSDTKLTDGFLESYSFPLTYLLVDNTTLGGNRQKLMEYVFKNKSAEYMMWCDADDMFYSVSAIQKIFLYIEEGFDALFDDFVMEVKSSNENRIVIIPLQEDHVHVHGKVYRREFL